VDRAVVVHDPPAIAQAYDIGSINRRDNAARAAYWQVAAPIPESLQASPVTSLLYTRLMSRPTRLSAGVVVVRETPEGWRYLLLRAYTHWDFPKGMVEDGEEPLAAAVREVREETCIDDLDFAWGEDYIETKPYSRGKVARYYLAKTSTAEVVLPVIEELGRPEHNEYRWVDEAEALRLVSARVEPVVRWAAKRLS